MKILDPPLRDGPVNCFQVIMGMNVQYWCEENLIFKWILTDNLCGAQHLFGPSFEIKYSNNNKDSNNNNSSNNNDNNIPNNDSKTTVPN